MGPSQRPFSSRPIHSWMIHQGWRIGCLRWAESLTSSFYTILNPVVSQDLLCELLTWPLPHSTRKSAPSMSGSYNSYFQPCYFGNFEYSFLLFLTINLKFPITLNKMTLNKWYFLKGDIINNIDKIMLEIWNFHQRLLYLIQIISLSLHFHFYCLESEF